MFSFCPGSGSGRNLLCVIITPGELGNDASRMDMDDKLSTTRRLSPMSCWAPIIEMSGPDCQVVLSGPCFGDRGQGVSW